MHRFLIFTRESGRVLVEHDGGDLDHVLQRQADAGELVLWAEEVRENGGVPDVFTARAALEGVIHQLSTDSDLDTVTKPKTYRWLEAICREALANLPEALLVQASWSEPGGGHIDLVRAFATASEAHRAAAAADDGVRSPEQRAAAPQWCAVFDLDDATAGERLSASELGTVLPYYVVVTAYSGIVGEPEFFETHGDACARADEIRGGRGADSDDSCDVHLLSSCAGWPGAEWVPVSAAVATRSKPEVQKVPEHDFDHPPWTIHWEWLGEGRDGDYDPRRGDDLRLYRVDLGRTDRDGDDAHVESLCTGVPVGTSAAEIERLSGLLVDALKRRPESPKRCLEQFSWASPGWTWPVRDTESDAVLDLSAAGQIAVPFKTYPLAPFLDDLPAGKAVEDQPATPSDPVDALSVEVLREIVRRTRDALYLEDGDDGKARLDGARQWDGGDELAAIAAALDDHDLCPPNAVEPAAGPMRLYRVRVRETRSVDCSYVVEAPDESDALNHAGAGETLEESEPGGEYDVLERIPDATTLVELNADGYRAHGRQVPS